jgi:hypothetical protein
MDRHSWKAIMKDGTKENQLYSEFKRRFHHLWDEASQLAGQGEVATLDSIVRQSIRENIHKPNTLRFVQIAAENYILKDW